MPSLKPEPDRWHSGHWLAFLVIPLSALFFIGGPDATSLPSIRHLWNLGHIAFFFSATVGALHFRPLRSPAQLFIVLATVFVVSFMLESVQRMIGRSFSSMDILRNLTGTVMAALLLHRKQVPIVLTSFFSLILLLDAAGFLFQARSDYRLQRGIPIIEDFEQISTLQYWNSELHFAESPVVSGRHSGEFNLQPARFAGAAMRPIASDWQNYRALELYVHSPRDLESFVIRIHDRSHERSQQKYEDRFNRSFALQAGWNRIEIPLSEIVNAPADRTMNLTDMYQFGFFISQLQQPLTLHLDQIQLIQ